MGPFLLSERFCLNFYVTKYTKHIKSWQTDKTFLRTQKLTYHTQHMLV